MMKRGAGTVLYGAADKVSLFVGPGPHGTPLVSREAVYRWLIRWLNDGRGDPREQPVKLFANHELLVTPTGRVEDLPGSRKLYQLIRDGLYARRKPGTTSELLAELRRLRIPTDRSAPAVKGLGEAQKEAYRSQRLRLESEPGIEIEEELLVPDSPGRKPAVLLLAGEKADRWAEVFVKRGCIVLKFNPRDSSEADRSRPYVGDWLTYTRADQIGLDLPALRAHDILRGVDLLAHRNDVDPASIRAAAQGVGGIWLLLAAAADPRISKIWLDRTPYSFLEALDHPLNTDLADATVFGFALRWDLDDLTKATGNRPVLWTDPTDWMGRVVPLGARYRYRYVLGDLTDRSDAQDQAYAEELLRF